MLSMALPTLSGYGSDYKYKQCWCFVAEVSSLRRQLYIKVSHVEVQAVCFLTKITCIPQMTLYSAVFGSPSRVRLAHARGLSCTAAAYGQAAGMHADTITLATAHELGMAYTLITMEWAARCNTLTVVQFLHDQGCAWGPSIFNAAAARGDTALCAYLHAEECPWSVEACQKAALKGHVDTLRWLHEHVRPATWNLYCGMQLHMYAAQGGSVDVLEYLQQQGVEFTAKMLTHMLKVAGVNNKLAAAQWLRHAGAEWPNELKYFSRRYWSPELVEWARAEGCTSPLDLAHNP
jgi:hypothetical protein